MNTNIQSYDISFRNPDILGFDDQDVFDAVINKSEELAHVCNLYRLKMAS